MQQILVYGDSLSWGIIPTTRERLPYEQRWPGVLEGVLNRTGRRVRIIEDCLNGRRTVWDDPYKPGRSGLEGLAQRIEINSPLALVILMLGTNDFQSMHAHTAWHSAQGIAALIDTIRHAPLEPGMPSPRILVVAPPPIDEPKGPIAPKFRGAGPKFSGLSDAYRDVALAADCAFVDAGSITTASRIDGVHLDAEQHVMLGEALADVVSGILAAGG